jgi:phosphatidylinositol-3-phosphatase
MRHLVCFIGILLLFGTAAAQQAADGAAPPAEEAQKIAWPKGLPVYDHVVIVVEENKDYDEIVGSANAPYINSVLVAEGANFTRMFGEEHFSQGNYYWLFSGDNQTTGFSDEIPSAQNNPKYPFKAHNLGERLIGTGRRSFKGYSEGLPAIGSTVDSFGLYHRKHVPWISFANVPDGMTVSTSSNLRFLDFPDPSEFHKLPTVAFVIPNLDNDMHNCYPPACQTGSTDGDNACCVRNGDTWLRQNLDAYYQWAKSHNSLLILTFDENNDKRAYHGLTASGVNPDDPLTCSQDSELCTDLQNRIVTIFAGAHILPGEYPEGVGITHVNILRTIEAMYKLHKSGKQQGNAAGIGITDDTIITDVFTTSR